jgi:hypothetical protein
VRMLLEMLVCILTLADLVAAQPAPLTLGQVVQQSVRSIRPFEVRLSRSRLPSRGLILRGRHIFHERTFSVK